jgi:hypothetical protein
MADGSMEVDWEKVEAIMVDLGYNMDIYSQRCAGAFEMVWNRPFEGATPHSYFSLDDDCESQSLDDHFFPRHTDEYDSGIGGMSGPKLVPQPEPPLEAMDPYGVTGMWRRIVCFLDYSDFYRFNFPDSLSEEVMEPPSTLEPRPPIITQEAIRLIVMKIRVTKLEKPGEDDGQELPVVRFSGTSRSMHSAWDPNANSKLRGSVRLTKEGEVRWTTLSVFHGSVGTLLFGSLVTLCIPQRAVI